MKIKLKVFDINEKVCALCGAIALMERCVADLDPRNDIVFPAIDHDRVKLITALTWMQLPVLTGKLGNCVKETSAYHRGKVDGWLLIAFKESLNIEIKPIVGRMLITVAAKMVTAELVRERDPALSRRYETTAEEIMATIKELISWKGGGNYRLRSHFY